MCSDNGRCMKQKLWAVCTCNQRYAETVAVSGCLRVSSDTIKTGEHGAAMYKVPS